MLPIYVYSNGTTATAIVNAIAALMNNGSFPILISISSLFAIIAASLQYLQSHDIKVMGRWFMVYFAIVVVLLGVKVPVQIIDLSNPMATAGAVDNVPWGLAMPASMITSIEHGISQEVADVLHTVDDEDYNKTGVLFGSRIFHTVMVGSTYLDSATREGLSRFVSRCIIPDIVVNHKYTFDQVKTSPNLFTFLKSQRMSPLRGIYYDGSFQTCAAVLPQLEEGVSNNTTEQFGMVAKLLGYQPKQTFNAVEHIANSYNYLVGISETAKNILMQNVAINAIREGISSSMAANNASSALINLSTTTAMHKQLLTDYASGHQATYMMPLIHTTLMLLLFGCFPIVVLIALIPSFTMHMLKTYLLSMIYLALWPLCFTIINYMLSSSLSGHLSALAIQHNGITLSNRDPMLYEIEQFAGYASILINLTPVLAGGMLFGMYRMFMSASQVMLGSMQAQVSQTASQVAQGDISLANTSVDNHNWNNWGANKHDLNATNYSGSSSIQLADGATKTTTQDGHTVMNSGGAISHLPVGLNFASSLASSFQTSHDHAEQAAMSSQKSFNTAISSATNAMHQYSEATSANDSYGSGASASSSTTLDHAMSNMNKLAMDASHSLGISESEAAKGLTSLAINGHVNADSGKEVIGKLFKWATGVSVGGNISSEALSQSTHDHSVSDSTNQSTSVSRLDEYRSSLQAAQNYTQNHHMDSAHSQSASLAKQFSSSLNDAQSASHNYSVDKSQSARYSQLASVAQQQSTGLNENLSQQFVSYVQQHAVSTASADAILSDSNSSSVSSLREGMASSFLEQYKANATEWAQGNEPVGMNAITKTGNEQFAKQSSDMIGSYQNNSGITDSMGSNTAFNESQGSSIKHEVQGAAQSGGQSLGQQSENISKSVDQGNTSSSKAIAEGKSRASEGIAHNVGSSLTGSGNSEFTSFIENHSGVKKF